MITVVPRIRPVPLSESFARRKQRKLFMEALCRNLDRSVWGGLGCLFVSRVRCRIGHAGIG